MSVLIQILLVFAFVLFVLAALRIPTPPARPDLGWAGAACAALALLLMHWPK